ncbi:MAG: methionyl-tRNA formyltransferase [Oceanospirillaceae bacterium]|nr:methionyl-tRNA formyltransferase [Oceanospirillaceae bacterium]MCP5351326.1 methionyl-tRNA formyltransferase [Oceanospirillaceae bacterium]
MRIVFAGTPEFAADQLGALIQAGHNIVAVYTQPDRPSGRGKKLTPSPVKALAEQHGLKVEQPLNFKEEADRATLAAYAPDLMVVVAYGLLLPQSVLDIPTHGCINAHASILPRWRGAAPIERALEAGDSETGVTIMQMEKGLDTGPMLHTLRMPISNTITGGELREQLSPLASQGLLATIGMIQNGSLQPEIQDDSQANYAHKLNKEEALLNWRESAEVLARRVRAFNPVPGAFTVSGDQRIKVLTASWVPQLHRALPGTILQVDKSGITIACQKDALRITQVQMPGKKPSDIAQLLNGNHPFTVNHILASEL